MFVVYAKKVGFEHLVCTFEKKKIHKDDAFTVARE